jgi:hypothetical protein
MSNIRPVRRLAGQAVTGLKDLPRNAAWLLSGDRQPTRAGDAPAERGGRPSKVSGMDRLPMAPGSVETRLRRAKGAVAKAKAAEEQALAEAQNAKARADIARSIVNEAKQRVRDANKTGQQEVERRTELARNHHAHLVEQEHEAATRDVSRHLERITADVQAQVDRVQKDAEQAARQAQARIEHAHRQMAAARALAEAATAAAQNMAEQAQVQVQAVDDEHANAGGDMPRASRDRRASGATPRSAARSTRTKPSTGLVGGPSEHTKAELIALARRVHINGATSMTKPQLVRAIRKAARATA